MKQKISGVIKSLIIGYLITFVMLLVMAFLMYRFMLNDTLVSAGIIATYAVSCFVGGFVFANALQRRRVLAGAIYAVCYMAVLALLSYVMSKGASPDGIGALKAFIICLVSGVAGGFLS